jgi:hypothetical protein
MTMPMRGTILVGTTTIREHRIFCRDAVSVMILVA